MTKTIYAESGIFKRFLAYIIDTLVLGALLLIVVMLFDMTFYKNLVMPDELYALLNDPNSTIVDIINLCKTNLECNQFYNSMILGMLIILLIGLVFVFVYFTVIPNKFKNYQTLGRYVTNLRVVDEEFYLPNFKKFFLRDFIGYVLMMVLNLFGIGLIINLTLILIRNRTLGDIIAKTKLINLNYYREITVDESKKEESEYVEVVTENNDDM